MDAYQRPLTIFDLVIDPTLDTAPILHALPPRDLRTAGIITLVICASFALTVLALPADFFAGEVARHWTLAQSGESRRISIDLVSPSSTPMGQSQRAGGGNGAIDPHLLSKVVANITPTMDPPEVLPELSPTGQALIAGDIHLPVVAGGNGLSKGTGEGVLSEPGGQAKVKGGAQSRALNDLQLVPIAVVPLHYIFAPGELKELLADVVVSITIDASGKVTASRIVSGPAKFHALALQAALKWRFEPLAAHGLSAPMEVKIMFHPQVN